MRTDRVKKGDLVIELRNRDGTFRLHAQKGVVAEPIMDRLHARIATLQYWTACIREDDWPVPDVPARSPSTPETPNV